LEERSDEEIPSTPPLLTPLGISCIFFVFSEFAKTDMRDDTSSPEAYECCDSDLWECHIRSEERYDSDEYKTKTPEYIDDGVILDLEGKEKEEDI
jgi:hypothetical protein